MTAILFTSLFPALWVFLIAALAAVLFGWLEIKRGKRLLIPRLVAVFLAIASLACMVLNPVRTIKKPSAIIILTNGFDQQKLDSLRQTNAESVVYQLSDAQAGKQAIAFDHYRNLDALKGNLYVLGQGMPPYMLAYLDAASVQFFPATRADGFTRINTNKQYVANQAATIEGIFKSSTASTLRLTGPGMVEDSVKLEANHADSFALAFTPKTSGLYTYTLTATDPAGKITHTEQLPVEVNKQKVLSILIVAAYPSAEIRFLKNFLGAQNHKVYVRYKVSKDTYRTDFTNTAQQPIGRLQENLLNRIDLVITDIAGFTSLSSAEIEALKESERTGLGSLILLNTADVPETVKAYLNLKVARIKNDSAQLTIRKKSLKISAAPIQVSSASRLAILQQQSGGRIIAAYHTRGWGKTGFQLLYNTYTFALSGDAEMYAQLWAGIVQALSRKDLKKYDVRFTVPPPYYLNEPIDFKIIASGEKPDVRSDSVDVPLVEDPLIRNVWHGKTWAGQAGWNALTIRQDSSRHNFFVAAPGAWRNLYIHNQQQALRQRVSFNKSGITLLSHTPISQTIFFITFLLSAGFLWLAPKL